MQQCAPCGEIDIAAAALLVGAEGTTFVGPFVPTDAEPAQIIEGSVGVNGTAAVGIEIFHAHDKSAACSPRALKSYPESTCMAHVEIARRRGREASAVTRDRRWGETGHADSSVGRARIGA